MKSIYYVYILESVEHNRFYFGVTCNVERRLKEHNSGLSRSTAPYKPFVLRRVEKYFSSREAYTREKFLKSRKSKSIIRIIIKSSPDVLAEQEVGIPIQRS